MAASPMTLEPSTRARFFELMAWADSQGLQPRLVSARRSCAEQERLYSQGRSAEGPVVTNARGCRSWHVLGRAFDLHAEEPALDLLGRQWEAMGGVWGGSWRSLVDKPHFEWHPGLAIKQVCPDPGDCEGAVEAQFREATAPLAAAAWGAAAGAVIALLVRLAASEAPALRRGVERARSRR